jgi:hypothetical protein
MLSSHSSRKVELVSSETCNVDMVSRVTLASEYAPFTETPWLKMQNEEP